ncbi:MAG: SH3 domain-containing protein [Sphingobacteriales bacterium]|nr:SH3 domain-containing protein [Sphingobacteriales bacterium]
MKNILFFAALLIPILSAAQTRFSYVAAKSGLSIRENPSVSAKVLDKIPYGTKITLQNTGEELVTVATEGMTGYWEKVSYNNKTGYIVGSYLLPVPPPKLAVVKEMKDYFRQVYIPFGNKLLVRDGERNNIEEGGYEIQKQLYKNGAEWHQFLGYEYGSTTWFLPDFTLQQGFLLLRLIPEFKELFGDAAIFPTESKILKNGEREYSITVDKEQIGNDPWIKKISIEYEDGAIYNFEMYQVDNQLIIFFGSGV